MFEPDTPSRKNTDSRYWMSWHQPTEDVRPLSYPPNEMILGWWNSGSDADGVATLCALVQATGEDHAKAAVLKDWPEAERWRFVEECEPDWLPVDRFPLSDWMKERVR